MKPKASAQKQTHEALGERGKSKITKPEERAKSKITKPKVSTQKANHKSMGSARKVKSGNQW